MITKAFILKLFEAASIQRWNDKMRPVELPELDKQAHKMIIAYLLGKLEEKNKIVVPWIEIIEGGIFELLQRIVLTDLKPQIYYKIKDDKEKYKKLNEWVFRQLDTLLEPLDKEFNERFKAYFDMDDDTSSKRVLSAAHFYATKWEFNIIEHANPRGYEIQDIKEDIEKRHEKYYDLEGMKKLILYSKFKDFVDLCGELRFQIRWSTTPRVPKTSVLGHMLIVAILSYLFTCEFDGCTSRKLNNYFTGLFHDLPEVLTRDIVSPVKGSIVGIPELIKEYEQEEMSKKIYGLLDENWKQEIKLYTEEEFKNYVNIKGDLVEKSFDQICKDFNKDEFNPRDGELIEAVDKLAAFTEAYLSIKHGITSPELEDAKNDLKKKYTGKSVCGINFGRIYADFD